MIGPRSWLAVCDEFASAQQVPRELFELLFRFRPLTSRGTGAMLPAPEPVGAWDFAALERTLLEADPLARIDAGLAEDGELEQADACRSRLSVIDAVLAERQDPSARLLRVGLRQRLTGILASREPKPDRLRGLADAYWSQLARHLTRGSTGPSVAEHVAELDWQPIADGLERARIQGTTPSGPIDVTLFRAVPAQLRIELVRGNQPASRVAVAVGFTLESSGEPIGLRLVAGLVESPPVFRRGTLAIDERGVVTIERLGLEAASLEVTTEAGPLVLDGQHAWNRSRGRIGPGLPSVTIVGDRVVEVGRSLAIPPLGFAVPHGRGPIPKPGDRVEYAPVLGSTGFALRAAIGAGPMLIEHGRACMDLEREEFVQSAPPVSVSDDESGDRNLLPRVAVGLDHANRLVLAVVDGSDFERALGMTLAELTELMAALGCHTATNLGHGEAAPRDAQSTGVIASWLCISDSA